MQRLDVIGNHLRASAAAEDAGLSASPTLASDDTSLGAHVADLYHTLAGPTPFSAKKNGGMLVAQVLKAHGVKFVFTLSGGHISPILTCSEELGIRVIDVRHEVNSVFAADAVARLTGVPGVAAVTAGPGVTNTITALKNAAMAESPLVLFGGAAATLSKGRGALQDVEQMGLVKSVCKFSVTVTAVRDIVPAVRRAFREAMSGTPGPCFVELPLDVLYPITEAMGGMGLCERMYKKNVTDKDRARVILPVEYKSVDEYLGSLAPLESVFLQRTDKGQGAVVDAYMKFKVGSLFGSAWAATEFGPLPVSVPQPAASDVAAAAALLRQAQRPVILIGSQATVGGPAAVQRLARAVNTLGVPVFLGGMARGLLGDKSALHVRQNRGQALKKADVIILAGAVCDFRLGYGRELPGPAQCKIVSVNRSRAGGSMNAGTFWNPHILSESCPELFVSAVAKDVGNTQAARFVAWNQQLKEAERKKDASNLKKASEPALGRVPKWDKGPTKPDASSAAPRLINPLMLYSVLEDLLPSNAILVADGGDCVATASYVLKPRGPLQWLDPGAFGTLGVGGGFALGAKLACPDKEVVLIWGDGSSGYSLAEFDTFTRHGVPVLAVVANDACWTQIEREQVPMFARDTACALAYCNYEEVAKGYGGDGMKLASPDREAISAAYKEGFAKVKSGTPFLINALVGKSDFREGSLSV